MRPVNFYDGSLQSQAHCFIKAWELHLQIAGHKKRVCSFSCKWVSFAWTQACNACCYCFGKVINENEGSNDILGFQFSSPSELVGGPIASMCHSTRSKRKLVYSVTFWKVYRIETFGEAHMAFEEGSTTACVNAREFWQTIPSLLDFHNFMCLQKTEECGF